MVAAQAAAAQQEDRSGSGAAAARAGPARAAIRSRERWCLPSSGALAVRGWSLRAASLPGRRRVSQWGRVRSAACLADLDRSEGSGDRRGSILEGKNGIAGEKKLLSTREAIDGALRVSAGQKLSNAAVRLETEELTRDAAALASYGLLLPAVGFDDEVFDGTKGEAEDEEDLWTVDVDEERGGRRPRRLIRVCLMGAAVVMAGGLSIGFVLGLLYASQRRRPVPATLYARRVEGGRRRGLGGFGARRGRLILCFSGCTVCR